MKKRLKQAIKKNRTFRERVYALVAAIPRGRVLTYKEIARRAGSPRAFRAVGNILNSYDVRKIKIPCHRVIRSDGEPGGYRWGVNKKKEILRKEGIIH